VCRLRRAHHRSHEAVPNHLSQFVVRRSVAFLIKLTFAMILMYTALYRTRSSAGTIGNPITDRVGIPLGSDGNNGYREGERRTTQETNNLRADYRNLCRSGYLGTGGVWGANQRKFARSGYRSRNDAAEPVAVAEPESITEPQPQSIAEPQFHHGRYFVGSESRWSRRLPGVHRFEHEQCEYACTHTVEGSNRLEPEQPLGRSKRQRSIGCCRIGETGVRRDPCVQRGRIIVAVAGYLRGVALMER